VHFEAVFDLFVKFLLVDVGQPFKLVEQKRLQLMQIVDKYDLMVVISDEFLLLVRLGEGNQQFSMQWLGDGCQLRHVNQHVAGF